MRRRKQMFMASLAGAAGISGVAIAQDSVSRNPDGGNGLPGDALPAWTISSQRVSYVVDLVPLTTSWRTGFLIGPIVKGSKLTGSGWNRFTALNGSSAISADVRTGAAYPSASYARWTSATGGVEGSANDTTLNTTVTPSGTASVFGVGFLEFGEFLGTSTTMFANEVVGAMVAFDPGLPSRMYVTRVVAAHNSTGPTVLDRSQLGFGSVDAHGNLYLRADGLTASATSSVIAGENWFRVRLASRSGSAINLIDASGASDAGASTRLMNNGAVTVTTPTAIPQSLAGRGVLVGTNFVNQLVREGSVGVLSVTTGQLGTATAQRGALSFAGVPLFAGSVGTGAVIGRTSSGVSAGRNDAMVVFGVDANGAPVSPRVLALSGTIADGCGGGSVSASDVDFRGYESQVTFRGGNGPIAVGKDQQGRGIAAGVVYNRAYSAGMDNPYVGIAAARFDPANAGSGVSWSLVAWTNTSAGTGKAILGDYGADGIPGTGDAGEGDGVVDATPIGRVASLTELSIGKSGPSMSAPMVDAAGNVWFTASVALNGRVGQTNVTEFTTALLRGVYDAGTFCYRLELVLKVGDTFLGSNSQRRYRIAGLGLADLDSVASEAPWSGSMMSVGWNGGSVAGLSTSSPKTLGGLVLSARIVYDVDQNGTYEDPTVAGGNTASVDEGYDVVLYVGNGDNTPVCPADLDDDGVVSNGLNPDGGVDINDLVAFLTLFEAGDIRADLDDDGDPTVGNPDGGVDVNDLVFFLQRFESGC